MQEREIPNAYLLTHILNIYVTDAIRTSYMSPGNIHNCVASWICNSAMISWNVYRDTRKGGVQNYHKLNLDSVIQEEPQPPVLCTVCCKDSHVKIRKGILILIVYIVNKPILANVNVKNCVRNKNANKRSWFLTDSR